MEQMIRNLLDEAHLMFPSFGERSADDLPVLARLFARELVKFSEDEITGAFRYHMRHGDRFPVISDIVTALTPVKFYRMDGGPKGFHGLYDADHPYVKLQERLGTQNLDVYAEYHAPVGNVDVRRLKIEARESPYIAIDNTVEAAADMDDRRGGGLQKPNYRAYLKEI